MGFGEQATLKADGSYARTLWKARPAVTLVYTDGNAGETGMTK